MKLKNKIFHNYIPKNLFFLRRLVFSLCIMIIFFTILIINLYYLQIINFNNYSQESEKNRIKFIPIIANRGIIYDRNKVPVAINKKIYQMNLIIKKTKNLENTLKKLNSIIHFSEKEITLLKNKYNFNKNKNSIIIKKNISILDISRFLVNKYKFPEIIIKNYNQRYYPYGSLLTHTVGYVSKIQKNDLNKFNKEAKKLQYTLKSNIGKIGIERFYENILHGKTGYKIVEVNHVGKIIRELSKKLPQSGNDIIISIDIKLQQFIHKLLIGSRAAVIVTNPQNGEILAMVSTPSYDPNLFVEGISNKDFNNLLHDNNHPLINRVTQGVYPPASTIKPYIALSALSIGNIKENSTINDPGWWELPGSTKKYRDWKRSGHGIINITKALEESADTFFYQIAYDMGIERLSLWMKKFGYGHLTGIDLQEENKGNMPDKLWKIKRFKKSWYHGDTIPVGIGQGYWTATPIQMNKSLMILINNGIVQKPHLILSNNDLYDKFKNINSNYLKIEENIDIINAKYWEIVKNAMYGVANRVNGTLYKNFETAPYKIAAKSGTSQVYNLNTHLKYDEKNIPENLRDHKLIIAFAPYNKPHLAITIILEHGGLLKSNIGILTRKIFDYILLKNLNSINYKNNILIN